MISLKDALRQTRLFEAMYGDRYPSRLTDMQAGCSYRRALEALRPEDAEPRNLLTNFIGFESPILYTLFT